MVFWVGGALALLSAQRVLSAPSSHNVERASDLPISDHVMTMKPIGTKSGSSKALLALAAGSENLNSVEFGAGYGIETTLGGKQYDLIFDSGSSDLWIFKSGCQCINANGIAEPASQCAFGPLFSGTYSGGTIPNKNFFIEYGSGEEIFGSLGYEPVTIAGVAVSKQEISLVSKAYWEGDGVTSGIVGFAYSSLTSQYPGPVGTKDKPAKDQHYSNFLTNAINEKKIAPLFTVIIERGKGVSSVTLGGVPKSVSGLTYTSTPLEIKDLTGLPGESSQYSYYTIIPQGYSLNGKSVKTSYPGIVDTGTTLMYLTADLAKTINAAYDPPSVYNAVEGVYENFCQATPPKFGLTIGGTTFYIKNSELLLQGKLGKDPLTGLCVSGVQSSGSNFAILGDVFLKNVVAVFDQGAKEMKFAPHETY